MTRNKASPLEAAVEAVYLHQAQASRPDGLGLAELHEFAVARTIEAALAVLGDARKSGSTKANLSAVHPALDDLRRVVADLAAQGELAESVGAALELLRGCQLQEDVVGRLRVETSPDQRSKGVYYTPVALAEAIAAPAIEHALREVHRPSDLSNLSIVDPAVGGGVFLLVAMRLCVTSLSKRPGFKELGPRRLRQEIASKCLYGVDIDPVAIATTRALIRAEVGTKGWETKRLDRHLRVADAVASGLDAWRSWFPERLSGFHVVLTNPPWSKLRPLRHEFFEHIDSRVRMFQGRELGTYLHDHLEDLVHGTWTEFVNRNVALSAALKSSHDFPISNDSQGDADLYKYFLELSVALLRPDGVVGVLLPSGFLRAQGSGLLRQHLQDRGEIARLTEFINKRGIFDIHSMYRFVSLLFISGRKGRGTSARFGAVSTNEANVGVGVKITPTFAKAVGGQDHLVPEVRSTEERDLLLKLFRLGRRSENISFRRELDMTNDSALFVEKEEAISQGYKLTAEGQWKSPKKSHLLIPLYEGRMVHQYDNAAKEYQSGHGRSARWEVPAPGLGRVVPHYFVREEDARSRGWTPRERFGYCEVSGHANERTILASRIPGHAICGNKVPVLRGVSSGADDGYFWLALANSLVIDWVMRRFVSTTVNQFYWRNIPFPHISEVDRRFCIAAAEAISDCGEDTPLGWLGRRGQLRAAVDAVVMKSFGFSEVERNLVLQDFQLFRGSATKLGYDESTLGEILRVGQEFVERKSPTIRAFERLLDPVACAAVYCTRDQAPLAEWESPEQRIAAI